MPEEKKTEVLEITQDQLKELLVPLIQETLKAMPPDTALITKTEVEAKEEKLAEAKKFICDLAEGKGEKKAIDSTSGSFGYTVPTALANAILEKRDAIAKMRKYAFSFKMAGKFQLPVEGTGVTSYWMTENDEIDESNPTVGKKDLDDYYLATRVIIPRKLLNTTAQNIVDYVAKLSGRSIKAKEEAAFIAGDGSDKPTGFRQATITQAVPQASTDLAYGDLINLTFTLPEEYRDGAIYMTSTAGMKLIRSLQDLNGLAIFDMRDSTILGGKPLLESNNIPDDLGTGGDETEIWYFNPEFYWVKDGEELFVTKAEWTDSLQLKVILAEAVDGCVVLEDAFSKLTGVK